MKLYLILITSFCSLHASVQQTTDSFPSVPRIVGTQSLNPLDVSLPSFKKTESLGSGIVVEKLSIPPIELGTLHIPAGHKVSGDQMEDSSNNDNPHKNAANAGNAVVG